MSELIVKTVEDLRIGRTSWRIMLMLGIPSLLAGAVCQLLLAR
jgi:hypothetical protein